MSCNSVHAFVNIIKVQTQLYIEIAMFVVTNEQIHGLNYPKEK